MRFWPLTTNERGEQDYTHQIEYTADDLTTTTANTAQTLTTPLVLGIGDIVTRVTMHLTTALKASGDNAFNTTTMSVGDSVGGVATLLAATELNENGTEIIDKSAIPSGTPSTGLTAATTVTVTFNAMAAKNLNAINTGVLYIYIQVGRARQLADAASSGPILTK